MALLPSIPLFIALSLAGSDIRWEGDLEAAQDQAKEEGRVVFIAVGMDGEARCEELVRDVYEDKDVVRLTQDTINLVASPDTHREGRKACPRFGGILCEDHCRLDWQLRDGLLPQNREEYCAVPQHVWLDPAGDVILSVPYELDAHEMKWCFVTALRRTDAGAATEMPEGARPPRRLVMKGIHRPTLGDPIGRGLTEEELEDEIKELKASFFGGARIGAMVKLLFTDEPDAVKYARVELGGGLVGWGDGKLLEGTVHLIGVLSPARFTVVLADLTKNASDGLRREIAVAFEQMGAPEGLKTVKSQLAKEKDHAIERCWLRALGACARDDKGARRTLLQAASKGKDQLRRRNAMIALGYLAPDEDVHALLRTSLASGHVDDRLAAACAMAISRDVRFVPDLQAALAEVQKGDQQRALQRALDVLEGGNLQVIERVVSEVAGDELRRERVFFAQGR